MPPTIIAIAQPRNARAAERHRLARELHDNVIQQVLAAGLTIDWCLSEVPAGSAVHSQLEYAKRLTRTAARQLRSSLQNLSTSTDADHAELPELLRRLVEFHSTAQLALSLEISGTPICLPATIGESLFRATSECLFNCAVHACAGRAVISLGYSGTSVELCVADDGRGDPEKVAKIVRGEVPGTGGGYHTGLADVAGRAAEIGAILQVTKSSLGGVAVTVTLPIAAPQRWGHSHG
jgi:signal transduction histidine kinase